MQQLLAYVSYIPGKRNSVYIEGNVVAAVHLDGFGPTPAFPLDQSPAPLSVRIGNGPAVLLHDHQHRKLMDGRSPVEHIEVVGRSAAIAAVEGDELPRLLTLEGETNARAEWGQSSNLAEVGHDV